MRTYIAFYRGKQHQLSAASSYQAQQQAAEYFRARRSWEVTVVLADVTLSTSDI